MRRLLTISFLLLLCVQAFADGGKEKYVTAMKGVVVLLDSAKSVEDLQNCANRFERIGNAEKKEWMPFYYVALCYTNMSYVEKDNMKKDPILDKAQDYIDKAAEIKVKDRERAEVYVVKGMILSARIQVEPQTRGMKYGPLSGAMFQKALRLDENNPRAKYLVGTNFFFTPKQFGGGKDKAIPMLKASLEAYDAWEAPSEIYPKWGRDMAEQIYKLSTSDGPLPWEEGNQVEKGEPGEGDGTGED